MTLSSRITSCAIVPTEVENAFNGVRSPPYTTAEGEMRYNITAGILSESFLGPIPWNVEYAGILKFTIPPGVMLVDFTDHVNP